MTTMNSNLRVCPEGGDPVEYLVQGRFVPMRWLGAGGSGEAWIAADLVAERPVVLKTIRRDLLDDLSRTGRVAVLLRFREEWQTLLKLPPSPNLIKIQSVFDHEQLPFIETEFLMHGSLTSYCGGGGSLPLKLGWLRDVACGLAEAAAAGILHRDVKPDNIVLRAETCATVIDFGLALATPVPDETWSFGGTREYAAPEIISDGLGAASERSDLYSFGLTALELIAGGFSRLGGALRYDRDCLRPPSVRSVVEACLANKSDGRPVGFAEVAAILEGMVCEVRGMPVRTNALDDLQNTEDGYLLAVAKVDRDRALKLLSQAAASGTGGDTGAAEVNRAYILADDDPEAGLRAAEKAVVASPAGGRVRFHAHMNAAYCLRLLKRPLEALTHCDAAAPILLKPWQCGERHLLYTNRALALMDLGRVEESLLVAEESRRAHPTKADLDATIGSRLCAVGEFGRAEPLLCRAAELESTDLSNVFNYSQCLAHLHREKDALAWLEIAYQIAPRDADVLKFLTQAYGTNGNVLRASELLPDAIAANRNDASLRECGRTILELGWRGLLSKGSGMREVHRAMKAHNRLREALDDL